ncbi:MAG: hypothetical protein ACOC9W_04650 [Persicimonas sp.]
MSFKKVSRQLSKPTWVRRAKWLVALGVAVTTLLASAAAFGATVLKLDLESLVANSEQIVEGEVVDVESKVEDDRVVTYTTIEVTDGIKGSKESDTVTIRQLGGQTEELATRVAGMAHFAQGERAMVFLERPSADATPVITGMSQGKFEIAVGPDNTTRYVVPRLGDISLLEPVDSVEKQGDQSLKQSAIEAGNYQPARPSDLYERVVPLEVFKEEVRAVVRDQEGE